MANTHFSGPVISAGGFTGDLTGDVTGNVTGDLTGNVTGLLNGASLVKVSETVAFGDFTDGGGAVGTIELSNDIPIGAFFLAACVTAITGFAGDVSAVATIGDGTDVDRYNTGTPSVFATAANGIAFGAPSGVQYHATAKTPVVTVTVDADWGSVTAGAMTIEMFYLT